MTVRIGRMAFSDWISLSFAGGWSDTPPICTERGGTVLNAAVTLNGLYPVQVMAKLNTAGCIRLSSIDLGERKVTSVLEHPLDGLALPRFAWLEHGLAARAAANVNTPEGLERARRAGSETPRKAAS